MFRDVERKEGWNAVGGVYTLPQWPDLKEDQRLGRTRLAVGSPKKIPSHIFIQDSLCLLLCNRREKCSWRYAPSQIYSEMLLLKTELLLNCYTSNFTSIPWSKQGQARMDGIW